MSQKSSYIRQVGLNDKEVTLIDSFLSIAKEDGFDVVLDSTDKHLPKVVLVDEMFHSDSLEKDFPGAAIFIIGDDVNYKADDYLHRPLKWSAFQTVLDRAIGVDSVAQIASEADIDEGDDDQFEVYEDDQDRESFSKTLASQMSYLEERVSVEDSQSQSQSISTSYSEMGTVIQDEMEVVEMAHSRVIAERALFEGGGLALGPNIVFWENFDCLMTVKSRPVLYILSSTGSVYSEYDFLDWHLLLRSKYARVYPLPKDWTAESKLVKYPLSWLVWFSSIARSKGYLLKSINKENYFMLDEWPAFDQVFNDNRHLRLCSLLSTEPHTLEEMVSKTRFKSRTVVAFLNACEKQNLLKSFASKKEALAKQKSVLPPDVLKTK